MKAIILFALLVILSNCSTRSYKEYSFKEKRIRELRFRFLNDSLGSFNVKYLCSNPVINIEQKFKYTKLSDNKILIENIEAKNKNVFIYIPLTELSTCINSNKYVGIERIPIINKEEILIYKKSLFWQKINNEKIISAFTFKSKN
ncbi:hypothetical protein [Empedobacter sp.]|uniref:hypothetical protein n=1 Tax=Empedobacter sp. TaxID=1927715 RepID=UPI0028AE4C15|nr:hypothetical protein [Empedobacter sp.]